MEIGCRKTGFNIVIVSSSCVAAGSLANDGSRSSMNIDEQDAQDEAGDFHVGQRPPRNDMDLKFGTKALKQSSRVTSGKRAGFHSIMEPK
jgi:hypothetical protein